MARRGGVETCWTQIESAAAGHDGERAVFARRYLPVVRSYLAVRWEGSPWLGELDDAVQEVFVECLRENGALASADRTRPGGFRRFLLGVARNVAARIEKRQARGAARREPGSFPGDELASDDDRPSRAFDRAWAQTIMGQALALQRQRAADRPQTGRRRRLDLLRLRIEDELPIREIAARWNEDPARVHRAYRKAREEYRACLREVIAYHGAGGADDPDAEAAELLALLE